MLVPLFSFGGKMGNTKTYYVEGELLKDVTLQQFKAKVYDVFHSTYCVAEIVEEKGGYLGTGKDDGPYIVAAIHSYSMSGDRGALAIAELFNSYKLHRMDADWSDVWVIEYDQKQFYQWRKGPIALEKLGSKA